MPSERAEEFHTAAEVADHLGLRPGTVLGWYRTGRIPGIRLTSKTLRFLLPEVLAALEAGDHRKGDGR